MGMSPSRMGMTGVPRPASQMGGMMNINGPPGQQQQFGPQGPGAYFSNVNPNMLEQAMRSIGLGGRSQDSLSQEDRGKLNQALKRMQQGQPPNPGMGMTTPRMASGGPPPGTPGQANMPHPGGPQGPTGAQGGPPG